MTTPEVRRARARVAALERHRASDDPGVIEAHRVLAAANLDALKARVKCAGGCGTPMDPRAGGPARLPPGVATCQECRNAGKAPGGAYRYGGRLVTGYYAPDEQPCPVCGGLFRPIKMSRGRTTQTCSNSCSVLRRTGKTKDHPTLIEARDPLVRPSRRGPDPGRVRRNVATRRARKLAAFVEEVDPRAIFERDGWRCHICRRKIRRDLDGNHPRGATLDHLVPLSRGGEHSSANVATAHRACNVKRGTRMGAGVQMFLLG